MRRLWLVAMALAAWAFGVAGAEAQGYPARTITIIVPFPPGGSTDTVARIMADGMQPILGQPVIIENVGGAGGSTAVGRLARAAPDGYTIDIGQWDTHVGSIIYKLTYDLEKDERRHGAGAGQSRNPRALRAAGPRCRLPRAADARGARCFSQSGNRQVVADHQGCGDCRGIGGAE
jgi:hypothetical protein